VTGPSLPAREPSGDEAPTTAEETPLTTDEEAQRNDTPAEPDTEAS
jgi:hypothetical protein